MELVRTAQSKHKINLLELSTEDGGPYVVATWYVVLIVCSINSTAQFKHNPLPASGALVSLTPIKLMYVLLTILVLYLTHAVTKIIYSVN